MKKAQASIIIPAKKINRQYLKEVLSALAQQKYPYLLHEIIFLPDKASRADLRLIDGFKRMNIKVIQTGGIGPSEKRNRGAKIAEGEILGFLDDDSYPDKNWLENAIRVFGENAKIAGVCGPTPTPKNDNLYQKVSGCVLSSFIGAGGAGSYRCKVSPRRKTDDYPSVNLLIKKSDFLKAGGLDERFWPGEDTKLCHDLVYSLGKEIIYDPGVLVYHHRRKVFRDHLHQIARYGFQRGRFVRLFPKSSRRLGYFLPSVFFIGLVAAPFVIVILELFSLRFLSLSLLFFYFLFAICYLLLLLMAALRVLLNEKSLLAAILFIPAVFLTHLVYGAAFIEGLASPTLPARL